MFAKLVKMFESPSAKVCSDYAPSKETAPLCGNLTMHEPMWVQVQQKVCFYV
jgi:hypothetical protein